MEVKYIYWFSYFNTELPSVRYRATYPLEALRREQGVDYSIAYPGYDAKSIFRFARMFFSALLFRKKDSLIVVQKLYTNRVYAFALKTLLFFQRKNTQYDLDDAEYLVYPPERINYFIRNCAACSVASEALLQYARKLNPNTFLLTSPVIDHRQTKARKNETLTLGWIGCYGGAHRDSLFDLVFPAIKMLGFDVRLVLLGITEDEHRIEVAEYFANDKHVTLELPGDIDWLDEAAVYVRICAFDLGLAPLLDIEMHRSKSAFKLKQYLSCGVPTLASGIGENSRFIRHGENGFSCNTIGDYHRQMQAVNAMQANDYERLSSGARESVPGFTLTFYGETLLGHYRREENVLVEFQTVKTDIVVQAKG
jgi:glycosyltransferase involved in cell wall biosynthesis